MKNSHVKWRALGSFVLLLVLTTTAQALSSRTWVAGDGNDANPCTLALPCQTFAAAILQTRIDGEINVKSAGEFGPLTINKSITIDGGGTFAGIFSNGAITAITVDDSASATPNTAVVTLRNLSINGAGPTPGVNGVRFASAKTLNIENCRISNFTSGGVGSNLTSSGNINIKNTSIFNAAGAAVVGSTTSGVITLSLNGCYLEHSTYGVMTGENSFASIRDTVIQFNDVGVFLTGGTETVHIVSSQINNNETGLAVAFGTTATIGSSSIINNTTNFSNGGTIQTFDNNQTDSLFISGLTHLGLK